MGTDSLKLSSAWFTSEGSLSAFLHRCAPLCPCLHYLNGLTGAGLFIYQKTNLLFIPLETKYATL